jgi:hypothetical protein
MDDNKLEMFRVTPDGRVLIDWKAVALAVDQRSALARVLLAVKNGTWESLSQKSNTTKDT